MSPLDEQYMSLLEFLLLKSISMGDSIKYHLVFDSHL